MLKYDFVFYREGEGGVQTHTSVEEHSSMELVVFVRGWSLLNVSLCARKQTLKSTDNCGK